MQILLLVKVSTLLKWADEPFRKLLEKSGSLDRYPIDCYEYISTCGAKNIANISTSSILAV